MDINYDNKGVTFVNKNGITTNLDWYEFWELCRHGRMIDTISEVKEYLENCDEISGVKADKILANEKLIEQIAEQVIDDRIGYESGDDIWDVANAVVQVRRDKL